ncbi:DIP1984 family protein [Catenulispora sp. NL8]|uniref:DIP1984 family protein n=1 Tax=Catenulispora pinistramenti TaxID=2705254 RepID=A0ABS5KQD4_9ACTN|nr:DIP1984 family protein [Catenulispora pinistramenti]MBS2548214.1 DIP1984 family protein [Catenulispora pinistramenti]
MKLAEALALRADAARRIEQLKARIVANARYQEGEEPSEDAAALLSETGAVLDEFESLVRRINRTNAAAVLGPDGGADGGSAGSDSTGNRSGDSDSADNSSGDSDSADNSSAGNGSAGNGSAGNGSAGGNSAGNGPAGGNSAGNGSPGTLSDALARRDTLRLRHSVITAAADAAAGKSAGYQRQLRSELKMLSALPVATLRAQGDALSRQIRELDVRIQRANWEVDLLD